MKLTIEDGGLKYSVTMPEDTTVDDFIENAQNVFNAVWCDQIKLVSNGS